MNVINKILPKRIPTKEEGVFYKEVQNTTIDDKGNVQTKIVDKVFVIRYRDKSKERFITMGKYSEGIRLSYCKQKRSEYMIVSKNGELPPQIEQRKKKEIVTLNDLANVYFMDKEGENKSNKKQHGRYKLHIEPILGSKDINDITKEDIKTFRKNLLDKKEPKTINGIIQLITGIINHSIKEYDLKLINPTTGIKRLKVDDSRERFLSIEDVRLLINEIQDNPLIYSFVKIALTTGARLESVLNIQKKDIDLEHNKITIKDLKSDKTYSGFFDDTLKDEIRTLISSLKANHYYIGGGLQPTSSRTIQNQLKPILDRLFNTELDVRDAKNRVVIHTLRHTFASQLAIKGVPIFTIQKLMSHSDITMTMRYAKLAPDSGRDAIVGLYN